MTVEEMKSTDAQGLHYSPITPRFGAELDADKSLVAMNDDEVGALVQLAADRGVVVVRDQGMTPQQQADFAHRLGRPLTTPMNKGELPEELLLIQANEKSKGAAGTGWHSDVSSAVQPPGLSMLRMVVVPDAGGDTLFADMRQVFASLSPAMQEFLQTLTARHEPRGHYLYLSGAKRLDELPSVEHPVVPRSLSSAALRAEHYCRCYMTEWLILWLFSVACSGAPIRWYFGITAWCNIMLLLITGPRLAAVIGRPLRVRRRYYCSSRVSGAPAVAVTHPLSDSANWRFE